MSRPWRKCERDTVKRLYGFMHQDEFDDVVSHGDFFFHMEDGTMWETTGYLADNHGEISSYELARLCNQLNNFKDDFKGTAIVFMGWNHADGTSSDEIPFDITHENFPARIVAREENNLTTLYTKDQGWLDYV